MAVPQGNPRGHAALGMAHVQCHLFAPSHFTSWPMWHPTGNKCAWPPLILPATKHLAHTPWQPPCPRFPTTQHPFGTYGPIPFSSATLRQGGITLLCGTPTIVGPPAMRPCVWRPTILGPLLSAFWSGYGTPETLRSRTLYPLIGANLTSAGLGPAMRTPLYGAGRNPITSGSLCGQHAPP